MPYDYQIETAYKILKNRYCMAEVATSGGKSLVISIVMFYTLKNINPDAKFLIIVPSITLVTQFYKNIMEYNYGLNNIENNIYDYNIEIEMEDGSIRIYKPLDEIETKNRGIVIAENINENDEI
jgi:superfamily II DNA or RNA helicase